MSPTLAWRMPAEWEPHEATWMAFPPPNDTFGPEGSDALDAARHAWAAVARRIAAYEPVRLVAPPELARTARELVGDDVTVVELALDDAWMRDIGPTFVLGADGRLGAVDWVFNGWGAQDWAAWGNDSLVGRAVAERAGAPVLASALTNEGGGIHVDGRGTVLLTESVQLDERRNPGWDRAAVEDEVHRALGTRRAIWLRRGLAADDGRFGTRGHVDLVACFTPSGAVVAHDQPDTAHPDHERVSEARAVLASSRDATGAPLALVPIAGPSVEIDGHPCDYSYVNHYVGNGFVLVGTFGTPTDGPALEALARCYPGRRIEAVDARMLFAFGGGVHCITQQQPAALR